MLRKFFTAFVFFGLLSMNAPRAQAPLLGEIKMFAGNFAPRGWAFCDGQLLGINENQALYSILGTTYGGNGVQTFALPDLRGRVPLHEGTGPGLSNYMLGQKGGTEKNIINHSQLPSHIHSIPAFQTEPNNTSQTLSKGTQSFLSTGNQANASSDTKSSGAGLPINNMPPYLTIQYIIATTGMFPERQ